MTNEIEDRWAALAARFAPAVVDPETEQDAVVPGQLREAVWGDSEATVLVVAVDDAAARVVVHPVSLEPGVANAGSVVLDADATSTLRGELSVWPDVKVTLSFVVLDGVVAQLSADAMRRLCGERSAQEPGHAAGEGGAAPRFGVVPLPGSGAAMAIDELFDAVDELCAVQPSESHPVGGESAKKFPLGLSALMATLQVSQPEAMAIIRGKHALTSAQAETVARVAGVPVAQVLATQLPLPADLLRELMEPHWRPIIRQRSASVGEEAAREELGRRAFALAARAKGSGRSLWRQRIQAVLAAESV